MTTTMLPVMKRSEGRRVWWAESNRLRKPNSVTPTDQVESFNHESSMVDDDLPPPVEVTLEEAKKLLKFKRPASPTPTTTSSIISAASNSPILSPAAVSIFVTTKESKEESPGWFSRRATRKPQQDTLTPSPPQLPQQETTITPERPPALNLTKTRSIPEFLTLDTILLSEMPPPALMDDASSVASASSSTITFSVGQVSLADGDDDDDDDDDELAFLVGALVEPATLDDPAMQTGWLERLWEMIDPDEKTTMTQASDVDTIATAEVEISPMSSVAPGKTSWWHLSRHDIKLKDGAVPIRPPSRGAFDEDDEDVKNALDKIEEAVVAREKSIVGKIGGEVRNQSTIDEVGDAEDEDIEKELSKCSFCTWCGVSPIVAPVGSTKSVDNEPTTTIDEIPVESNDTATEKDPKQKVPTEETANDSDGDEIGDHVSVILSKLDLKLFPWICRAEEVLGPAENTPVTKDVSSPNSSPRKVRFAPEIEDEDDDEIRENADIKEANEETEIQSSVEPSTFSKFFDWLVSVETGAVSLSDTNDALCQPINDLAESETGKKMYSLVRNSKIPQEISMLACNLDDATVLTLDPAFRACSSTSVVVEEKPKPLSRSIFRRNGKILPALNPPFLRKAPVNKDREKHELEIARAMWRHYKKTKAMKDSISDMKRMAERQRQREEWAAAVAAHRKLRLCNHVNCQCHQERW